MLTAEQYAAVVTAGIGIPATLSICGLVPNNVAACALAAAALFGLARAVEELTEPDYTAVGYADSCARMLAITALAETASTLRRWVTRGIEGNKEVRLYECIALLMIGALLLAQFVEILQIIIPGGIDAGTFLGIVVAGLTFSLRDLAACIVGGLFESIRPRFAVGDRVTIGSINAVVLEKGLMSIRGEAPGGRITFPTAVLSRDCIQVHGADKGAAAVALRPRPSL